MKANELRIGNWIEFNNFISHPNNLQVTPRMFRQLGMDLSENLDLELSGYHKPILLTEEWLVKFGFVKFITKDVYPTFANNLFNWNNGILYLIGYGFMNHVKHVHQLQNLYFALTGKELEITN